MERRSLLRGTGLGALAAGTLAAPAIAQSLPTITWRLASAFPRSLDILFGASDMITKRVAALTDGKFQIRPFPAGDIVPALQVLDAVKDGTIECGHTPVYYYTGKDPCFSFFTAMPFGLNARQEQAWFYHGEGSNLLAELLDTGGYNTVAFPAGNTGAQMGGWFRKEVKSLEDVKGLKFRIAGLAGQVFAKLGAVPTQIAAGDIYPALERGTLDAVEFVGPYDDEKLGFSKVAPFYYYPGFWEAGASLHMLINKPQFEALPKPYQEALRSASAEANIDMLAKYDHHNPLALRRLVAGGTQLRPWPRDMMDAAWRVTHELYNEIAATNPLFKKILESYLSYRDIEYQWFRVSENSFDNYAFTAGQRLR